MKKVKFLGVLLSLTLILAACGGTSSTANTAATVLNEDYPDALSVQTQLTLGTLKLEETNLAVDADQAAELLTLWQAIRSLSSSDITAEGEIEAIVNQILETMSSAQLEAIAAMELSQEGIFELTEELGIARSGNLTADGNPRSSAPDGIVPGSGPGGGLGGGLGGGRFSEGSGDLDLSPEQIATLQAERAEKQSSGDRFSMFLINPLIQMLEGRSQS